MVGFRREKAGNQIVAMAGEKLELGKCWWQGEKRMTTAGGGVKYRREKQILNEKKDATWKKNTNLKL